jgi:bifunctional DNase/RNase
MTHDRSHLVEVKIGALIVDPNTNSPIVILKGVDSDAVLPIWVGPFEANAIAVEIQKIMPQRPMTHDLLRNLVIQCGLDPVRVVVTDLADNTFYARIDLLDANGNEMSLDSRPSDAIAFALRVDCPIFVKHEVFEKSAAAGETADPAASLDDPAADEWPELID